MAVLMAEPGLLLGVQAREVADDAHGYATPVDAGPLRGPWPGRTRRRADGTWSLALDPAAWPVAAKDLVVEVVGGEPARRWVVDGAELRVNNEAPDVDYVAVEALIQGTGTGAGSTPT